MISPGEPFAGSSLADSENPARNPDWLAIPADIHYIGMHTTPSNGGDHGKRHRMPGATRHIHTLFQIGTIGGLTDRDLLEQFAAHAGEQAELAFTTLVERHGPMVHRVCRSILRDASDAHDAFQASFLVLARSAGSLHVHDSLRPWLHQVACRTAACAAPAAARNGATSWRTLKLSPRFAHMTIRQQDLAEILDAEVNRFPPPFRDVIVASASLTD